MIILVKKCICEKLEKADFKLNFINEESILQHICSPQTKYKNNMRKADNPNFIPVNIERGTKGKKR